MDLHRSFYSPLGVKKKNIYFIFIIMVLPAIFFILLVKGYGLFQLFHTSLYDWPSVIHLKKFIGLDNYFTIWEDDRFYKALLNSVIYTCITTPIPIFIGLIFAYFLSFNPKGHRYMRIIYLSPYVIPQAALAVLFGLFYLPDGLFNYILKSIGLGTFTQLWLANPSTQLFAIMFLEFVTGIGWFAIVFYGRIVNIPQSLYEAAYLDGANKITVFFRITLPLSKDMIGTLAVIQFIFTFHQTAKFILLLGFGKNITLGYLIYIYAFKDNKLGYSQSIAVIGFLISIVVVYILRKSTYSEYEL